MLLRRTRRFLFVSLIAGACAMTAHAAELGDVRVGSHIGQPLVADIELTLIDDPAAPVQVRVANAEVYNAAGVAMAPALSGLHLAVMRRDGRQFLHVTSLRTVDADHLHLYLELSDRGQRNVRLATLWLTPDPTPAATPMTVPPAPVLLPSVPAPRVERPAPPPAPMPVPVPAVAPAHARERVASVASAPKRAPAHAAAGDAADADADADADAATVAARHGAPASHKPASLPLQLPQPATCAGRSADAQACAALGAKNAELRARIGKLEARVETLRVSLGAAGTATPAAAEGRGKPAGHAATGADAGKPSVRGAVKAADARDAAQADAAQAAANAHAPAAHDAAGPAAKDGKTGAAEHAKPDGAGEAKAGAEDASAHEADAPSRDAPAPGKDAPPEEKEAAPKPPARPKPISSIKTLVPHKPKAPPADEGLPWGWIAGGLGALAGAGAIGAWLVARLRKRKADPAATAAAAATVPAAARSGLLAGLRARLGKRGAASPKVEPAAGYAAEPAAQAGFD